MRYKMRAEMWNMSETHLQVKLYTSKYNKVRNLIRKSGLACLDLQKVLKSWSIAEELLYVTKLTEVVLIININCIFHTCVNFIV